jgi:DNA primase
MDTLSLIEQGIRNVAATLGTATTPTHLQRLFRISPDIIFCFDGDQAGRAAAWRALEVALPSMVDGHQVYFLFLPEGEDPDSLLRREGAQSMQARIQQALPLSKVLLNHLRAQADTSTIDGRARLLELARPLLKKVPAGAFRLLLAEELAQETHLEASRLASHLELKPKRSITRKVIPKMQLTTAQRLLVMLLQNPVVALMVQQVSSLHEDGRQEVRLLAKMIELAQNRPHLSMAALIESCRESDEIYTHLLALAQVELALSVEDMKKEFLDGVRLLQSQQIGQRIDLLLHKAQRTPLTDAEKDELRHLLSSKSNGPQSSVAKMGS